MWRVEEQKNRHGAYLYIRDEGGYFCCFYRGCGQKLKEDFGGHIEGHETRNDEVDDDHRKALLAKYRNRPEVTSASSLRVKSSLRRSKESEISLQKCEGILEILCTICDSVPLSITAAQESAIYECREGFDWTLSNLVFEPLRARGWSLVSTKQALDLGTVYRKLKSTGDAAYKDAEDFAIDVRHALNYMRMAAGNATVFAALPGRDFQMHLQRLATEFAFQMEYERLNQRFDNVEKKMEATYGSIELPYSVLIELLGALLSSNHSSVLELPDSSLYYSAYLSDGLPHFYHGNTPMASIMELYDHIKNGDLKGAPSFLFSRMLRSYFHHILLWNEHQNDSYIHTEKLAHLFESQLEKAAQQALRDSHRDFRYSARDQHAQLLIWDPKVKQYYLEYFTSPTTEWQSAAIERQKIEDLKAAEAGPWSPELAPSNSAKQLAESLRSSIQWVRNIGDITRFATAPAPEPASAFVSAASASSLLSSPTATTTSQQHDPNRNMQPHFTHSAVSTVSLPIVQRAMPGATPISQHHHQQHHHVQHHVSPTPMRNTMSLAPNPSNSSMGRVSPSPAPFRPSMPYASSNAPSNAPMTTFPGPSMAPSPHHLGTTSFGSPPPARGPSPAPSAAPNVSRGVSQAPFVFLQQQPPNQGYHN